MVTLIMIMLSRKNSKKAHKDGLVQKAVSMKVFAMKVKLCIVADIVILIALIAGICMASSYGIFDNMGLVASTYLSTLGFDGKEEKEDEWILDDKPPKKDTASSGGMIIIDKDIRFMEELITVVETGIKTAEKKGGIDIDTGFVIGALTRETGTQLYTNFRDSGLESMLDGLVVTSPICKKNSCNYINNGISHFVGGTVENGIDKGDPYKSIIDYKATRYYDPNLGNSNHGVGWGQMETIFVYNSHLLYEYPKETQTLGGDMMPYDDRGNFMEFKEALTRFTDDTEKGFLRPNIAYIPDVVYNMTISNAGKVSMKDSQADLVAEIKTLNPDNQRFFNDLYAGVKYGSGGVAALDWGAVRELIELAKRTEADGSLDKLQNMLVSDPNQSAYWDSKSMLPVRGTNQALKYMQDTYGVCKGVKESSVINFGLSYACIGQIAYNNMKELIANAERTPPTSSEGSGAIPGEVGSAEYLANFCRAEADQYYSDAVENFSGLCQADKNVGNDSGAGKKFKCFYALARPEYMWCAIFSQYVLYNTGLLDLEGADRGSRGMMYNFGSSLLKPEQGFTTHWRSKEKDYEPQVGDIIQYTGHVGIVVAPLDSKGNFKTAEGNTGCDSTLHFVKGSAGKANTGIWNVMDIKTKSIKASNIKAFTSYDFNREKKEYEIKNTPNSDNTYTRENKPKIEW